ncbi:MAG: tetratricopeptide repeat protein [Terriglobia bacterium]
MIFRRMLALFILAMGLTFALPTRAQEKPFTQDEITNMVRGGLGDDSGAKLIGQRGIDFAPAENFLQSLKAAGASDSFLRALRAAKAPPVASSNPPLNQVQILALLAGGVSIHRIAILVAEHGINFDVKNDFLSEVLRGGGDDEINDALKSAKVTKPVAAVDPAEQARQTEIRQHMAHGTELANKGQHPQAEQEYRAALRIDPENADLYASLAYVLIRQQRWIDAESALRSALRLDPNNDMAHNNLGVALGTKRDIDGAIAEFREALRLNPNFADAHANLGAALGIKGEVDGAIAEYREALRLNPKYAAAHFNLGLALERKGSFPEALEEYHSAYTLNPNDADYQQSFERLSKQVKKQ